MGLNSDSPEVAVPPPLMFLAGFLIGLIMEILAPLRLFYWRYFDYIGFLFLAAGFLLAIWAVITMRRAKTSMDFEKPASKLVTDGPFSFSRNPLYLSAAIFLAGLSFIFDKAWAIVMLIPTLLLVQRLAVEPEERYLESKFGKEYRLYIRKVRRWV